MIVGFELDRWSKGGDMPEPRIADKRMIEQLFDGAAATYNRTGPNVFTIFGTRLVELMPLALGARVLDVATGTGAALFPAARRVGAEGHVTGIDLSGAILEEADGAARTEGLSNFELHKMDAEHIEFYDQTFDAVICALSIFLFPDLDAAMREMYRVCKPGGHLGVSVFGITSIPFDPGMTLFYQQAMEYQEVCDDAAANRLCGGPGGSSAHPNRVPLESTGIARPTNSSIPARRTGGRFF